MLNALARLAPPTVTEPAPICSPRTPIAAPAESSARVAALAKMGRASKGSAGLKLVLLLLVALLLGAPDVRACLGQTELRIREESRTLRGTLHRTERKGYSIIRIERQDATVVTQYLNANGLVFGVTWQAPGVPDMKTLLGAYFPEFQRALRARGHRSGPLILRTKNLEVESLGHMRAFHGRIYVPGLLPKELTAEVIR